MSTAYYTKLQASLHHLEQSVPEGLQADEQSALSRGFARLFGLISAQIEAIYEYDSRHRTV